MRAPALRQAIRFLTVIAVAEPVAVAPGKTAIWFVPVGLALGGLLALVHESLMALFPPELAAWLVIGAWACVTGGLHLDGLADSVDGLAGRSPEDIVRIMRDSRIGVFGTAALILMLILKGTALAASPHLLRWRTLIAAPAIGRAAPVLLARLFPPATPGEGQGSAFMSTLRWPALVITMLLAVAASSLLFEASGLILVASGGAAGLAWGRLLVWRLGGLTGDGLGGAVEVAELATLLAVTALVHIGRL